MMTKETGSGAGRRRREQILKAAYGLVVEHGQLTVQMVADEVNITDAAVLYHFRTKEHLLVDVLRYVDDRYEEFQSEIDQIDRAVLAMREFETTPNLMMLFAEMASRAADTQHPAHEYFTERYGRVQQQLVESAKIRLPDHSLTDINNLVRTFLAAIDGLQRRWMVEHNFDLGESARSAENYLFGPSAALEIALKEVVPPRVLPLAH